MFPKGNIHDDLRRLRRGERWQLHFLPRIALRFQEGHLLPQYQVQAANCQPVITYDLLDGRYFASRMVAEEPPAKFDVPMKKSEFNPGTVQAQHLR